MNCDNLAEISVAQLMQAKGWQVQYRLIIQWGALITHKPELRQEQYLIKGCETSAWLSHSVQQDCHRFMFDSDSRVINGLAALLLSLMDKKMTSELAQLDFKSIFLDAGLQQYLNPSRSNGLRAIIRRACELAECAYVI